MLRALRSRAFPLLWGGRAISALGGRVFQVALAWWVLEKTGSTLAMATVIRAILLAAFGIGACNTTLGLEWISALQERVPQRLLGRATSVDYLGSYLFLPVGYERGASPSDVDARPAANALSIAVSAYRATSDARYLTVADALVDWARPSLQPFIHGPNGQEQVMGPWRLNMYLRSLSDYVEMRREFGLPDTYNARGTYLALADWLRTYAWIDLAPIAGGPRAAYPYEWWFDGRTGIPGEDNDNGDASVNNWLLLGADAMAYAYTLSGNANYLEWASRRFRTGSHDPWFEGDPSLYSETKQTANGVRYGNVFLYQWARR